MREVKSGSCDVDLQGQGRRMKFLYLGKLQVELQKELERFIFQLAVSSRHLSGGGLVTQSCLTLCNPMDCRPPGSSVHRILQARIVEWVAMPSSRVSSQPRDRM